MHRSDAIKFKTIGKILTRNKHIKECKISKGKGFLPRLELELKAKKLMVEKARYLLK